MSYIFAHELRTTLAEARQIASTLGHKRVAPEHLLLSLLRAAPSRGRAILEALEIDLAALEHATVQSMAPAAARRSVPGMVPYSGQTKAVVKGAMRRAQVRKATSIDTADLLLSLLETPRRTRRFLLFGSRQMPVSRALGQAGLTPERVLARLRSVRR